MAFSSSDSSTMGFNDYITKPIVDESLLLNAMEKWIAAGREGSI